jgi:hypothetical protein
MQHFLPHAFEIKAVLDEDVHFERWDKGWSKIYQTIPLAPYDDPYLERVAERLARQIEVLQPILAEAL